MGDSSFVGRNDVVANLIKVLKGERKGAQKLTIQGIGGPGGIGKSALVDHALGKVDLEALGYLVLTLGEGQVEGLANIVGRAVESSPTSALHQKPVGFHFPSVRRVRGLMEEIRAEAIAQAKASSNVNVEVISEWFDMAMGAGIALNDVSPITQQWVNFSKIEKHQSSIKKALPLLTALQKETPGILARLGIGGGVALRNSIRENPARALADALTSDLSAIISGYRRSDWAKPVQSKLEGIERLLLIVEDYEFSHKYLGRFLVSELLPMLRTARFESVVIILGRDSLASMHVEFDSKDFSRHQLEQIFVGRLAREDLNRLLADSGFHEPELQERAWQDTEGYPYYVELWMEEARAGTGTAEMARRFYRRTTRWMSRRQARWLDVALFLDDVNKESLRWMLGDLEEAEAAFKWFEREGSVRDTSSQSVRVRNYIRVRLLAYLRNSDPERFRTLEQHATRVPRENPVQNLSEH